MDSNLDFMEWHDAYVDRVVRDENEIRLEISSLNCYRKLGPDLWDWEIGDAVLVLHGAQVVCDPPGDERTTRDSSCVMDCTESEPVAYDDIQSYGHGTGPGRIAFLMLDGSTVSATFQRAQLTLVGPLENKNRPYRKSPTPPGPEGSG